ncbi:hypothetical protein KSS87_007095 [Heliosperma pusillum]|nr:hypothetical protein KSS87_007095 [Heliosperma pusillum]
MDGHDSDDHKQNSGDMTAFVQNLLQQMSINELKSEMGADASPSPVAPSKSKSAESKSEEGSEE